MRKTIVGPRTGVTLIEVLVVVAIIALLVGLIVPAVQRIREAVNRAQCGNSLHQLAISVHLFQNVAGRVPYNQFGPSYGTGGDSRCWSWLARLLPYLEQENLYKLGEIPDTSLAKSGATNAQITLFLCPSDNSWSGPRLDAGNLFGIPVGQTNYKGVMGANWGDRWNGKPFPTDWRSVGTNGSFNGQDFGDGVFYRSDYLRPLRLENILDGTSNTFMIGEDVPQLNQWCSWPYSNNANGTCAIPPNAVRPDGGPYPPINWENTDGFRSRHPGGVQFGFADGAVHFVSDGVALSVYRAMATISGGEVVEVPE